MSPSKRAHALTDIEARVLSVAQLDSRMSIADIARLARLRAHTVHRALRSLRERSVIEPFLLINPHYLGLNDFCLFFNLRHNNASTRGKVIAALKASPFVAYGAELAGEYQYTASIFSSSVLAVQEVLNNLAALEPNGSIESTFALRTEWNLLETPFHAPRQRRNLSRPAVESYVQIDGFDRKFLYHLSLTPGAAVLHLAQKLGVSEGTLRARFYKLCQAKVILGIPYHVHWARVGFVSMRAMISFRGSEPAAMKRVYQALKKDGEITDIVRCLGGWQVECNFRVPSPPAAGEFVQRLHGMFDGQLQQVRCASEVGVHVMHRFPKSQLYDS